ncbi:MAG: ATP-binding protein [bacterium]|nr:ATP-binding protein [bacterium]
MKHLPIAKTELREIVEEECAYVDKTAYIKMLLDDRHKYYFLSRPRRFGKTLFVDTLRAAFAAEKELFQGLFLEKNWNWQVGYPIISISLGGGTVLSRDELHQSLDYSLRKIAREHRVELFETFLPKKFDELITQLYEKYEQQVVVLIDEYDKPLLDNLTKPAAEEIRETLSSFYSILKDASRYLKFVFLTGVSRFSKTSIFSKLNNLTDISLVPKYADICGITQTELEKVFGAYLHDVNLDTLRRWYNGYNFRGSQMYNPYDVLMSLWEREYKAYWFKTGTPTFLLTLIKQRKFYIPKLERLDMLESQMEDFDIEHIELDALLFQAGYLTIKDVHQLGTQSVYTLTMPNQEVKMGLNDYLLRMLYASAVNSYERTALSEQIYDALSAGKPSELEHVFKSFFAAIPTDWYRKNRIAEYEGFYCSMFYAIFASMGLQMTAEDVTNKGRIDLSIDLGSAICIFEFKMKTTPQNALQQIKERKYYEKYLSAAKNIFLIGIEFDEAERNISAFECERLSITQKSFANRATFAECEEYGSR